MMAEVRMEAIAFGMSAETKRRRCSAALSPSAATILEAMLQQKQRQCIHRHSTSNTLEQKGGAFIVRILTTY